MRRARRERGVALLVALTVMVSMVGLVLGLFFLGLADNTQAKVNRGLVRATAMAEGATEVGHKEIIKAVANNAPVPTGGTAVIGGTPLDYTITPIGDLRSGVNAIGLQEIGQLYSIQATGEWHGIFKHVEKVVDVTALPLFQFAIFYDEDLEIQPGPSLTIVGRVHTNRNMYLGAGATLTFATNYVRAGGHIYRRDKTTGLPTDGIINFLINGTAKTYLKMESQKNLGAPSVSGFDSDFTGYDKNGDGDFDDKGDIKPWTEGALDKWNGTVRSVEHDYLPIEPPPRDMIEMYSLDPNGGDYIYDDATGTYVAVEPGTGDYKMGVYYENAGLVVIDGRAYDSDGVEITSWSTTEPEDPADNPLSESTFYDAREEQYVTVTNIDMSLLAKSGHWPENGLMYATRTDATAEQPNGIRLKNASVFPAPLSVVSPVPVYLWGDYNEGNKTYPKVPAAVMTDSLNILSNAWDDTKSAGTLPHANPTTINCAIMTGAHPTTDGQYNGGFENLPRFHEKWDGNPCEIRGAFIYVWDSEIGTGKWAYGGDRYTALSRDWNYDTMFNDPNNLPPYTPKVYFTRRVVWVSR